MSHQSISLYIIWSSVVINPLNAELNPICHLLALLGAHHILHISRIRVKRQILHLIQTMKQYFGTQSMFFITFKHIKTIIIIKLTRIKLNY